LVGLTYADSEQDGVIKGSTFYHTELNFKINFPEGWLIKNKKSSVVAISRSNDAFFQLSMEDRSQKISASQFLKAKLGEVAVLSEMPLRVAGESGHSLLIKAKTPYGFGVARVAVVFVEKRAFLFYAAVKNSREFERFDKQFLASIRSLAKLTKADKGLAKPLSIQLIRLGSGSSRLSSVIKRSAIPRHAEEQIKLLNNVFSTGALKSGDLIKIVR